MSCCSEKLSAVTLYDCNSLLTFFLPDRVSACDIIGVSFSSTRPPELQNAVIFYDPVTKKIVITNFSALTHTIKFCYCIYRQCSPQICVNQTVLVISDTCGGGGNAGSQGKVGKQGFRGGQGRRG